MYNICVYQQSLRVISKGQWQHQDQDFAPWASSVGMHLLKVENLLCRLLIVLWFLVVIKEQFQKETVNYTPISQSIIPPRKSGQEHRQEPRDRNSQRGHGRLLLTGMLLGNCLACSWMQNQDHLSRGSTTQNELSIWHQSLVKIMPRNKYRNSQSDMKRTRYLEIFCAKLYVSIKSLFSGIREPCGTKKQKGFKSQRGWRTPPPKKDNKISQGCLSKHE